MGFFTEHIDLIDIRFPSLKLDLFQHDKVSSTKLHLLCSRRTHVEDQTVKAFSEEKSVELIT